MSLSSQQRINCVRCNRSFVPQCDFCNSGRPTNLGASDLQPIQQEEIQADTCEVPSVHEEVQAYTSDGMSVHAGDDLEVISDVQPDEVTCLNRADRSARQGTPAAQCKTTPTKRRKRRRQNNNPTPNEPAQPLADLFLNEGPAIGADAGSAGSMVDAVDQDEATASKELLIPAAGIDKVCITTPNKSKRRKNSPTPKKSAKKSSSSSFSSSNAFQPPADVFVNEGPAVGADASYASPMVDALTHDEATASGEPLIPAAGIDVTFVSPVEDDVMDQYEDEINNNSQSEASTSLATCSWDENDVDDSHHKCKKQFEALGQQLTAKINDLTDRLVETRTQLVETRTQLVETRTKLDETNAEVAVLRAQVEKLVNKLPDPSTL